MHPYQLDASRPCTVTLSPRQWTRIMLDPCCVLSQHTTRFVLSQLPLSDHYPTDLIPASATPREASFIVALIRDYTERGY
jgi:hypothetical protein